MKSEDTDTVKSAKADVFIVHSVEDSSQAAIINKTLEEFGLSSFDYKSERHAFTIGKPVFDNIVYAIKHAEIVLILVTEHSMKSHWVSLETQVALENSQRGNILSVRLVFAGVSEKDRLEFKHGMLATIPDIVVDFNKEHWKESFIKMIKGNLIFSFILQSLKVFPNYSRKMTSFLKLYNVSSFINFNNTGM
jgi:hypothetical protein